MTGGPILCVQSRCRSFGQHKPDCDIDCRGCLPRLAADGCHLCHVCTRRLAEDATIAAQLYAELEGRLAQAGASTNGPVSGTHDHGTNINEQAVECRTLIRHTLVSWALLIADERGYTAPADDINAIAEYVGRSSVWLSAHSPDVAKASAEELGELAHGKPWRTAYPSGARRYPVAACLLPDCPGTIIATLRDTDQLLPSALTCNANEAHVWSADGWRALGRALHPEGLAGRYVTAHETAATWRRPLGTVYRLAHENHWTRSADMRRPTLYLAADVDETMRTLATKGTP